MPQTLPAPIELVDFLEFDDASDLRHELIGGRAFTMVGETMRHHRIAGSVFRILCERLEGTPCQVFMEGMKLHVQALDCVYYPDVFVFCGSAVAGDAKLATDATLIVEVLSDSTADIEVHERDAQGQRRATAYGKGEAIPATDALGAEPIPLARLYAGTNIA